MRLSFAAERGANVCQVNESAEQPAHVQRVWRSAPLTEEAGAGYDDDGARGKEQLECVAQESFRRRVRAPRSTPSCVGCGVRFDGDSKESEVGKARFEGELCSCSCGKARGRRGCSQSCPCVAKVEQSAISTTMLGVVTTIGQGATSLHASTWAAESAPRMHYGDTLASLACTLTAVDIDDIPSHDGALPSAGGTRRKRWRANILRPSSAHAILAATANLEALSADSCVGPSLAEASSQLSKGALTTLTGGLSKWAETQKQIAKRRPFRTAPKELSTSGACERKRAFDVMANDPLPAISGLTLELVQQVSRSFGKGKLLALENKVSVTRTDSSCIKLRVHASMLHQYYDVCVAHSISAKGIPTVSCTCLDFEKRGGICKHGTAALLMLLPPNDQIAKGYMPIEVRAPAAKLNRLSSKLWRGTSHRKFRLPTSPGEVTASEIKFASSGKRSLRGLIAGITTSAPLEEKHGLLSKLFGSPDGCRLENAFLTSFWTHVPFVDDIIRIFARPREGACIYLINGGITSASRRYVSKSCNIRSVLGTPRSVDWHPGIRANQHSKICVLVYGGARPMCRVVVGTCNLTPGHFKQFSNVWWVGEFYPSLASLGPSSQSCFHATLLRFMKRLSSTAGIDSEVNFNALLAAVAAFDFSPADAAGVRLLTSVPVEHKLLQGELVGAQAMQADFADASRGETLNTWAVVHSVGGKVGRAGAGWLAEALAPNGGILQVAWPTKDLATFQQNKRVKPYLFGGRNVLEAYSMSARSARLLSDASRLEFCPLRPRTHNALTRQGRPALPHAMLYALVASEKFRRLIVGSSNLSVEALGHSIHGRYQTYSFEACVALTPDDASFDAPWVVIDLAADCRLGQPIQDINSLWTSDPTSKRFRRGGKR